MTRSNPTTGKQPASRLTVVILGLVSLLIGLLVVEGGYRLYLSWAIKQELSTARPVETKPSFTYSSLPNPEKYNAVYGFDYEAGSFSGQIVNGLPVNCSVIDTPNSDGNMGAIEGSYEEAGIRAWMFGSSFTMISTSGGQRGDYVNHLLQRRLSDRLGEAVHIVNFSRASYGLVQMFDMAVEKLRINSDRPKPTFMLFLVNTSDIIRSRHWRWHEEVKEGYYQWIWSSRERKFGANPGFATLRSETILSKYIDQRWCDAINNSIKAGKGDRLADNPTVGPVLENLNRVYRHVSRIRRNPRLLVNFFDPRRSFAVNQMVRGNPYAEMNLFDKKEPGGPIHLDTFSDDGRFVAAVDTVKASKIPFYIVHIPYAFEMERNEEFVYERAAKMFGYSDIRLRKLIDSLPAATGTETISLLPYMNAPVQNAFDLVDSSLHWNVKGVYYFSDVLEKLFIERFVASKTTF